VQLTGFYTDKPPDVFIIRVQRKRSALSDTPRIGAFKNCCRTTPWSDSNIVWRGADTLTSSFWKGALLLTARQAPLSRSTMDIDLLGKNSNQLEHVASIVSELCTMESEADGNES
jgi:hypothetical protein